MLLLLLTLMIGIQIPAVQTKVAHYAIKELNKTFDTQINVDRLSIEFFGDINLYGVTAKDEKNHDFIEIERVQAKVSLTGLIMEPNRINIRKLTLYHPHFDIITYKGESESNFISLINRFSSQEEKEKSDFKLRGILKVIDGELLLQNLNLEGNKQNWVEAKKLNLEVENFKLEDGDIWGDLKQLGFEGKRNGEDYYLKDLSARFHLSGKEMRFDALKIHTEDSDLNGNLVFSFDSMEDFQDFENLVKWDLILDENSRVGFKDIRYFVDDFNKDSRFEVQGTVVGTLNHLILNDFQISSEGIFLAAKELTLIEVTNGEKMQIDSKTMKAKTSYRDLNGLLPYFISNKIPDFIERFGTMDYSGNFHLDPNDIDVDGYAITELGDADLLVELSDYRNQLKYKGTVTTQNMNLHQITDVKELGFVSGKINFDGQGMDIKTLKLDAKGDLAYLDLMDKRYHHVSINGRLAQEQFKGILSVNDPYLNANYDGIFDFSRKPYRLTFNSLIKHIDMDYLGLTKEKQAKLSANVQGDFTFSSLDDFLGSIEMENVNFESNIRSFHIDHAHIISSEKDNIKNLELDIPGYLKGNVNGQYKLSQLPDAIMNSLGSYTLITYKPTKVDANQNFNFYFEFGEDLLSMIDDKIQISPGTIVDGHVDTTTNFLMAELSSSGIGYDGFNIYNPLVNIDTSKEQEQIYVRSDSALAKGIMLYNLDLHTTPIKDSLLVKSHFQIGKEFPMDFKLNLFQTINEDKNLVFGFSPSTIKIDENEWFLNPNNDRNSNRVILNFDKNYYELQNLLFESVDQSLMLDGYYANATNYKLNADLEQLVLSNIIPKYLLGNLKIDGIANGNVNIVRSKDKLEPLMELRVDELALNDYELGTLGINGVYNVEQNVFDLELFLEQQQVQVLYVNGFIDNKPEKPEINMVASLDDLNFKFVESFLSAAMSNMRGKVSGNMRFTGPIDSPDFEGMLDLADLGFKVDYLNVDYQFDGVNTVPVFKQSGGQGSISLNDIPFRDTKYGTKGEATGQLLFRDFASWFLNLSFNTNNLLVLNTNIGHNDLFYGKVFAQGAFGLFGPPESLDISARATVNEGSEFTINTGATKVESDSKLVRFIPEKESEEDDGRPKGMNIDLDISANPSTTVNLIFDPISGDMVTANGYANNLKFKMSRAGAMSLDGAYILESGKYEFRQVPILNRDFEIQPGSYVRWDGGSAFDADMNITATYEKTVSNVGEYLGAGYSQSYDVTLGIVISESLADPEMDFTLNIPKGGTDVQSLIDYKFNLDPDEKMIQFGAILLFGQFMTNSDAVLTAGATSTGAGIALKQLGGIINSLIAGGGFSIGVDYVTGSNMSYTSDMFKTDLKIDLSPRWTFNGAVGVPVGSGYANETATGEAEIEWDISNQMDKTMVINFFTRPTNFGVQNFGGAGNFQSFGAGITYKTSFDRISEIFSKEKRTESILPLEKSSSDFPSFDDFEKLKEEENDSIPETQKVEETQKVDSLQKEAVSKAKKVRKKSNGLVRFK